MTATYQKIELMSIATVKDLDAEIAKLTAKTQMQEEIMKLRLKKLPKELAKAAAIAIIPGFLAARISKRGYGVASGLLGWLFHKKEDKKSEAKEAVVKSAKQVGIYTGLSFLFKTLKKKYLS